MKRLHHPLSVKVTSLSKGCKSKEEAKGRPWRKTEEAGLGFQKYRMSEVFEVGKSHEMRRKKKVWICEDSFLPAFYLLTLYRVILFKA